MKKYIGIAVVLAVVLVGVYYKVGPKDTTPGDKVASGPSDFKNAAYMIDGTRVELKDGVSVIEAAPGSTSKTETRYFGNDLVTDLNADGREDRVFWITQSGGGSGTFYYVVAAINTETGYVGTDGYPVGDRIAPQSIDVSSNPKQKYVIVANYADRKADEPMTAQPSVGKSVYLKIDPSTNRWGIVEANFEGESR